MINLTGTTLQGSLRRYRVREKLGSGQFGQVYSVKFNHASGGRNRSFTAAVKVESADAKYPQLAFENRVLNRLYNSAPDLFPKPLEFIRLSGMDALVMERLDCSLGRVISGRSVFVRHVAVCILNVLHAMHSAGVVHRDIKPENTMFFQTESSKPMCPTASQFPMCTLVDYGLSKYIYRDDGEHFPQQKRTHVIGTPSFMSLLMHRNMNVSMWQDVESLCYMLIFMRGDGRLPWDGLCKESCALKERSSRIHDRKVAYIKDLRRQDASKLTPENKMLLECMQPRQFGERPDHGRLITLWT